MSDESPCIGICEIADGYCIGCGRSEEQIFGETDSAPGDEEGVAEQVRRVVGGEAEASDD